MKSRNKYHAVELGEAKALCGRGSRNTNFRGKYGTISSEPTDKMNKAKLRKEKQKEIMEGKK